MVHRRGDRLLTSGAQEYARRSATVLSPRDPRSADVARGVRLGAAPDLGDDRLCGPGEWLVEKHSSQVRRSWRKLHLGTDAETGEIVAVATRLERWWDISRLTCIIGPSLRSHKDPRRLTEVRIAVGVLNQMLALGRSSYVRTA